MNEGRRRPRGAIGDPESSAGPLEYRSPDRPQAAPEEITLRWLLGLARKRRNLILATLLVTFLGVAFVTFRILTPLYESTAVVLIKPGREFTQGVGAEGGTAVPNRMEAIVMAELEILHSEDLLRDTVTTLGPSRLYPDLEADGAPDLVYAAARRFRQDFSATAVSGAAVIRLSFRHPDPVLAAESVNGLVGRFREHHLKAFAEPQSASFLEGKVTGYRQELEAAEQKVFQFQKAYPFVAVENPGQELEAQRIQMDTTLSESRNNVDALNQRVAYLKKHATTLSRTSPLRRDIDLQLLSAEAELRAETARQQGLRKQRAAAQAELQTIPGHLRRYRELVRERDAAETRHRLYSERLEQASVSAEMDREKIANISVIQKGEVPPLPSYPRKMLILAVGSILGLGLGFGLALLLEGLRAGPAEAS